MLRRMHPSPVTTIRGPVAEVTHDGSARGNAFTTPALVALVEALEAAAARPDVAVVHLVMAGRHFSTGWDTTTFPALAALAAQDESAVAADLRANDALVSRVRDLPVPVVAAVRGRVAGFGAGLLAAVHVPVAAHDVTLALPEIGFGICPGGVLHTVLTRVPRPAADLLVLSGEAVDADDLLRWGLVAQVVPADSLDERVAGLVARIAGHPGDVVRRVRAATLATLAAGTPEPAYDAAAASVAAMRSGS